MRSATGPSRRPLFIRSRTPLRLALGLALLAGLLIAAGRAAADEDDDVFGRARPDMTFGLLAGSYSVGRVDGPGIGLHLDAGWRTGRLYLYGEYDFLSIGQDQSAVPDAVRGLLHRFGGMARFSFSRLGGHDLPLEGQFWLEGGAGREIVAWDGGGRLHRNDLALGIGSQLDVAVGRYEPHPQVFGLFYAFRLTVARAPDADKTVPPTCAGPCDQPTPPSPWDLGIFFNAGLSWGRR